MLMQCVVHCMAQKNVYEMDGQAKMWEDNFWWWRTIGNTNRPVTDFWGFLVDRQWRRRGSVTVNCCEPCSKWQCMEWKHPISGKTKNLNPKTLQVKWFCSCSGNLVGQYWNITVSKAPLLLLHCTLKYWYQSWNQHCATSTVVCCPEVFFCSTITHFLILWQVPLKQLGSWNLNFRHTPHIVRT